MAALLNGESVPRAALMAAIERWNAGGDWPTSLGGPPRRHGCALPEDVFGDVREVRILLPSREKAPDGAVG